MDRETGTQSSLGKSMNNRGRKVFGNLFEEGQLDRAETRRFVEHCRSFNIGKFCHQRDLQ